MDADLAMHIKGYLQDEEEDFKDYVADFSDDDPDEIFSRVMGGFKPNH